VWALCSGEASAQAWVSGEEEEQLLVKPQGNQQDPALVVRKIAPFSNELLANDNNEF
jgi:hypothetical protein